MRRRLLSLAVFVLALMDARPGHADVGDAEGNYTPEPSTRRDGLSLGLHLGSALGAVSGYPNEVARIGRPEFEQNTGLGAGPGGAFWVGLSPRDFFTFGLGYSQLGVTGNQVRSVGSAFLVHIEVFPAFYEGRIFEDLGFFVEGGAGPRIVEDEAAEVVADGGFTSFVGAGAFWEGLRLGSHVSVGPVVQYTHQFSLTLTSHVALVGVRLSYTGGPSDGS
jgi:hypothetical protein